MLIATAGHVDHGKSALVRALTGVETDRLPEEKARGLTIDLGFAYRTLAGGVRVGFVDVPGHERFVRNMLAGVGAVDFALLVVAADDGPMPQTLEHLAILDLLGIERGAGVVTKTDRVDAARVARVRAELERLLAGTTLAGAEVLAVSAHTGAGIADLEAHLAGVAAKLPPRSSDGAFRLAVDRSFTVAGAGLVVTGAVFSGGVRSGDRLRVEPGGAAVRVRALHRLGEPAESARAGERCALNLAGSDLVADALGRGRWVVGDPCPAATERLDARVRVLAGEERGLSHWTPVHVHLGAAQTTGRVALLEGREIGPHQSALAQVVLDRPMLAVHGDRFVLRDQSARRTIGGGRVIDPFPPLRRRGRAGRVATLGALEPADPGEALGRVLDLGVAPLDLERFAAGRALAPAAARAAAERRGASVLVHAGRRLAVAGTRLEAARRAMLDALARWHRAHPDAAGPDATALRAALETPLDPVIADLALDGLLASGEVRREGAALRAPGFEPEIPPADRALLDRLSRHVGPHELQPPVVTALGAELGLDRAVLEAFLERCARRGHLVRVAPNRYLHPRAFARLVAVALELAGEEGARFTARAFRDAAGIGRNFTIEVLERLDALGVTRRIGDERVVARERARRYAEAPRGERARRVC